MSDMEKIAKFVWFIIKAGVVVLGLYLALIVFSVIYIFGIL